MRHVLLLVTMTLAACSRGPEGPRNVLLVTLDTTRADRIGCYGHAAARTPALDGLAAAGARFERAYAHVPLTLPSHATLLTGVHPTGTGLHVNFQGALSPEVPTLAERFAAQGRRTGAFVAAWVLNAEFGLARGFERYDDLSAVATRIDQQAERPAGEVCDAALAWLDEEPGAPFFCWVHFYDAHDPYAPPAEYAQGDAYDGEIAYADAQLARLLAWLDEHGLRQDTLVVVTADHGECLGEHGEPTHGLFVYEPAMRVPLVVAWPRALPAGGVVDATVGLVDVAPTVAELCELGRSPVAEGRSLVPALRGEPLASDPVVAESEYPLRAFGWAPLHTLISERWKWIEAPAPELYELPADPGELANVAGERPDAAEQLRAALAARRARQVRRGAGEVELGAGAAAQLSKLGYVAGRVDEFGPEELAGLRDPKDAIDVYRGTMRAKTLLDGRRWEELEALTAELVARSPESDDIWSQRAKALLELGRYAEAVEAWRNSLRAVPDRSDRRVLLGDSLRGAGRTDEALGEYERALELDPDQAQAHSRVGLVRAQRGELAAAERHFRRQVALEPRSPNARCNLANALFAQRRFEEGLAELEAALEIDPDCQPALQAREQARRAIGQGGG